eukprot:CAMPEP_0119122622 /NCGR_PEP_ID=MMETSP1310-20130426/2814_1 /TAXON_ID=464262 /ORGANISM="Genus nov. species nov., Strain RCC2339" /LENGTH=260 /DNA_ID=CAMNT_0007112303 /DNA_START=214 /DNA_END=996 /DNA_ORIENTATION=+
MLAKLKQLGVAGEDDEEDEEDDLDYAYHEDIRLSDSLEPSSQSPAQPITHSTPILDFPHSNGPAANLAPTPPAPHPTVFSASQGEEGDKPLAVSQELSEAQNNVRQARHSALQELRGEGGEGVPVEVEGAETDAAFTSYGNLSPGGELSDSIIEDHKSLSSSSASSVALSESRPTYQRRVVEDLHANNRALRVSLGTAMDRFYNKTPDTLALTSKGLHQNLSHIQGVADNMRLTTNNLSNMQDLVRRIGLFCPMQIPDDG